MFQLLYFLDMLYIVVDLLDFLPEVSTNSYIHFGLTVFCYKLLRVGIPNKPKKVDVKRLNSSTHKHIN